MVIVYSVSTDWCVQMLATDNMDAVVDGRVTVVPVLAHLHFEPGETTASMTMDSNMLTRSLGVKTPSQFNITGITVGKAVGAPGNMGFTFSNGNGNPIRSFNRAVVATPDGSDAFHALHTTNGAFADVEIAVHPTDATLRETLGDMNIGAKRLVRWREAGVNIGDPTWKLMTPANVTSGAFLSTAGDDRKMIVCPLGEGGITNAVSELVRRNADDSSFLGGRYAPANAKTVPMNGQMGLVMTESDFNTVATPLAASLRDHAAMEFDSGLTLKGISLAHPTTDAFTVQVPLKIHRAPPVHDSEPSGPARPLTLANLHAAIDPTLNGTAAPSTALALPLATQVHGPESSVALHTVTAAPAMPGGV